MRKRVSCLHLLSGLGLVLAFLYCGPLPDSRAQKLQEEQGLPKAAAKPLKRSEILQILTERIDVSKVQGPRKLKEFLDWIQKKVETKRGVKLPILVNTFAFLSEDPDAPPIFDTSVSLPESQQFMTVGEALGSVLSQVPTRNASFLIRKGGLEITTDRRITPEWLFEETVFVGFAHRPFGEVLEELSEQTGVNIVIDPRINNKLGTPITAAFTNNTSLEVTLLVLTNMAKVDLIVLNNIVFITTPENAQQLRPVQKKLNEFSPWPPSLNPPGTFKKLDAPGPGIPGLPGA